MALRLELDGRAEPNASYLPKGDGTVTKYLLLAGVFMAAALLTTPLTIPARAEIPSWIAGDGGAPLWISVEEAAPGGEMRWEYFHPATEELNRERLKEARSARLLKEDADGGATEPCSLFSLPPRAERGWAVEVKSPEDLRSVSEMILTGKVTDSSTGFYLAVPATVFEIEVNRYLKVPEHAARRSHVHVVLMGAVIQIGDEFLCVRTMRGVAPTLGSSVLLTLDASHDFVAPTLVRLGEHEVFFTLPDGTVSSPSRYLDQQVDLSALEAALGTGDDR